VILAVLALVFETSTAFSTASSKMTFQPARIVPGARVVVASRQASQILMSGETTTESTDEGASKKPMPTSGTYYDDEVRFAAFCRKLFPESRMGAHAGFLENVRLTQFQSPKLESRIL
jgi:hypothetical protein